MHALTLLRHAAVTALLCAAAAAQSLVVGDPAPKIKVSAFLRGEPISAFERDTTYVVEFWATWCVPCRKTIPHLSEVQRRFADKRVKVFGVAVWEDRSADVAPFVEKLGDAMAYTVATDFLLPEAEPWQGAMALSWLRAAGESSLPTVFIVDGSGRIAWIGDSLSLEAPLEQIVAGTWDLEAAKAAHARRIKLNRLGMKLAEQLHAAQWSMALATVDEMNRLDPASERRTAPWRFQCLLNLGRDDQGYEYAKKAVEGALKDDALGLNLIAWFIVDPKAVRAPKRDLDFALRAAKRAVELSERHNGAILDTLALVHFTRGEIEQAIEIQELAAELCKGTEFEQEIRERLEQFRNARQGLRLPDGNRR